MTILEYVVNYLDKKLPEPVRIKKPDKAPKRYILIEKTGFDIENYLSTATVVIESYAESLYATEELSIRIRKRLEEMADNNKISSVRLDTDYPDSNADKKENRYQAVYKITHYMED